MLRFLRRSRFTKALPLLPLTSLSSSGEPSESVHSAGDVSVPRPAAEPPNKDPSRQSPLTFGKVFGAIPRVTQVNTPNINQRISDVFGLPTVTSSEEFRKSYVEGRDVLRYVILSPF